MTIKSQVIIVSDYLNMKGTVLTRQVLIQVEFEHTLSTNSKTKQVDFGIKNYKNWWQHVPTWYLPGSLSSFKQGYPSP